jgi:hypothetical protein
MLELDGYGGLGRLFTKCFSTCLRIENGAEMENHQREKERAKKNMPKVFHFAIAEATVGEFACFFSAKHVSDSSLALQC